jgi:hypothetical protein
MNNCVRYGFTGDCGVGSRCEGFMMGGEYWVCGDRVRMELQL